MSTLKITSENFENQDTIVNLKIQEGIAENQEMIAKIELERDIVMSEESNIDEVWKLINEQKSLLVSKQEELENWEKVKLLTSQSIDKVIYLIEEADIDLNLPDIVKPIDFKNIVKITDKKYDFVYVYRSLHLNRNKNMINERKIRKIFVKNIPALKIPLKKRFPSLMNA